jgi:cation diffusion facilitator CzcD-associated flavoprotein CzcO
VIQPVAVIGAGPFGLSTAAHLRARGIPVRVFGEPMVSWRDHMPAGMLLKSTPAASNIDAPQPGHNLVDYCDAAGIPAWSPTRTSSRWRPSSPTASGSSRSWCPSWSGCGSSPWTGGRGRERGPEQGGGFELKLDSGELFTARAVVVATGLSGLAHLPPELAAAAADGPTPTGPVSHSSQHHDLTRFKGKELIVVGAGQSALETAALAAEAGAKVRIVSRGRGRVAFGAPPWQQPKLRPESPFGRAWSLWALSYYPQPYRYLPPQTRHYLVRRVLGPLGAWWLRERFEGKVQVSEVERIVRAEADGAGPRPSPSPPRRADEQLTADHVIAATGYRVDIAAMDFLGHELRTQLAVSRGTPKLGAGYVSSVPGCTSRGCRRRRRTGR